MVLNLDNAESRRTVEQCYRTNAVLVNPIIDWTDEDVWEFIHTENIPYCGLYDEGIKRIGCVGCPLEGFAGQRRDFERWPGFRKMYTHAFEGMLQTRAEKGIDKKTFSYWTDADAVFRWWVGEMKTKIDPDQMKMEEVFS